MFKHNLTACLNTQRPNRFGDCPIRIRTTIKRKVAYYSTGLLVKPEQWANGEVIKHPNKVVYNLEIQKKIAEIANELVKQSITGEDFTTNIKTVNLKFGEYAEKKIKQWSGVHSSSSTRHRYSELNKFNEFSPKVRLRDIDNAMLNKYEDFCRDKKGNNGNTVWTSIKFIKLILNAALKDRVIQKKKIVEYTGTKYIDPFRNTLSEEEIARVEAFADNPLNSKKLLNVANWFLFSCYTGLRYGDLAKFKGFVNNKVLLQTEKTKEIVSIFATGKIKQAHARLKDEMISNQKFNDYLKSIAAVCAIDKQITCHTARHTFATLFLHRGGRMEILQKLMGHTNIQTTQKYAKISAPLIDQEMKKVWDK